MKPYIKGTLCALLSCCAASAADTAAPALTTPQPPMEKPYFDMNLVNVSFAYMKDVNNGLSVDDLAGGTLSLGQSFGETSRYYHTWYARIGYLFGRDSFLTNVYKGDIPRTFPGKYSYEQSIIPITLGYTFHYKWTDRLSTYVGAQAGFHYSKSYKKVGASGFRTIVDAGMEYTSPSRKDGHTSLSPTLGLELGIVYKFNKRISWDTGVNFNTTFNLVKEGRTFEPTYTKEDSFNATFHTGILFTF